MVTATCPEIMCHGIEDVQDIDTLMSRAGIIAIGPGLGRSNWGSTLFQAVLTTDLPLVADADALNLLAKNPLKRDDWILTPHPGEAARLLDISTREIQSDRFSAVHRLQERFGGTCLLKGAGTLVCGNSGRPVAVCTDGNPGMASGGMGDVLTGIIAGLMAQGWNCEDAACMGACLHGAAADIAAQEGERGMLATDLMPQIRRLLNPECPAERMAPT